MSQMQQLAKRTEQPTMTAGPMSLIELGQLMARSGFFQDTRDAAQAFVKVQAGAELGIPPVASMMGIQIIAGKVALSANLMAGLVRRSGRYDFDVLTQTDTECSIQFMRGEKSLGVSKFTIEQARKAGTKNLDKFPRNMLFARAMSNGVKWYCPDVFLGGAYTPEELGAEVDSDGAIVADAGRPEPEAPAALPAATSAPTPAPAAQTYTLEDERERLFLAVEKWTGIERSNRDDFMAALQAIAQTCRIAPEQQRSMAAYQTMRAFVQRNAANNRDFIAATEREAQRAEATRAASDQPAPTDATQAPASPAAQAGEVDQGEPTKTVQWPTDVPPGSMGGEKPGVWTTRVVVTAVDQLDAGETKGRKWRLFKVDTDFGLFTTFSDSFAELLGKEVLVTWAVERGRRTIKNYMLVPPEEELPF